MLTSLHERKLGPLVVTAPATGPQCMETPHGSLWQWQGDGGPLLGLVVAVGRSMLELSPPLLLGVLNQHVETVQQDAVDADSTADVTTDELQVPGAACGAVAQLRASRVGHPTVTTVAMLSDGQHLQVSVEIVTLEGAEGDDYVAAILDSLMLDPTQA